MEFLFDSANLKDIEWYSQYYPITGVTSNPSILKQEGKIDFFDHMRKVRKLIGLHRTLHVQVIESDYEGILREAEAILNKIDDAVYIKIPTTEQGLKAMAALKKRGANITATAIYSKIQGFMAIATGADFIAPYYNRMENIDIDFADTISTFRKMIDTSGSKTKILAASFKNVAQINKALLAGSHAVTIQPGLIHDVFHMAALSRAVREFRADWVSTQGDVTIDELAKRADAKPEVKDVKTSK